MLQVIKMLLDAGASCAPTTKVAGATALHLALYFAAREETLLLLSSDEDTEDRLAEACHNMGLLHLASSLPEVKMLTEVGAAGHLDATSTHLDLACFPPALTSSRPPTALTRCSKIQRRTRPGSSGRTRGGAARCISPSRAAMLTTSPSCCVGMRPPRQSTTRGRVRCYSPPRCGGATFWRSLSAAARSR